MTILVKKLNSTASMPTKAHSSDAGWDLTAISKEWNEKLNFMEYDTGLAIRVPPGHTGLLFPRSSISKTPLMLANCVGVLDHEYTGSIKLRFRVGLDDKDNEYNIGDRICQLIVVKFNESTLTLVEDFENTIRGEKGFGSSGK